MVSRRAIVALAVVMVALPAVAAQLPASPLDPVVAEGKGQAQSRVESVAGPTLTREEVDVRIEMEFRDVDFDTVNVIFGGGKFSATARIVARVDLSVLSAARVQDALEGVAPGSSNLTATLGAERSFIPADAFRASVTAEALAAFQDEQEAALADYLRRSVPNVSVLSTTFEWTNTSPSDSLERRSVPGSPPSSAAGVNDPTYPPITLRATVDVEYLERTSLLGILDKALAPRDERERERERQVADAAAFQDRGAFGLLGIRQVLDLQAPEGWNVEVHVRLPEGYTFEEASPDVALARNLREANVLTLGRDADSVVENPVALTLSNRFLVSTAMLAAVLLVGAVLRLPVFLASNYLRRVLRA